MNLKLAATSMLVALAISNVEARQIVTEEMMVNASDPGIECYVRNKRHADLTSLRLDRTVLYRHGATDLAHSTFDLTLDGQSRMAPRMAQISLRSW